MIITYKLSDSVPSSFPRKAILKLTDSQAYRKHEANKISKEEYESHITVRNLKKGIEETLRVCVAFALEPNKCDDWDVLEAKDNLMKLKKNYVAARSHLFSEQETKTIAFLLNILEQIYGLMWQEKEVSRRMDIMGRNLGKLCTELYESLSGPLLEYIDDFMVPEPCDYIWA